MLWWAHDTRNNTEHYTLFFCYLVAFWSLMMTRAPSVFGRTARVNHVPQAGLVLQEWVHHECELPCSPVGLFRKSHNRERKLCDLEGTSTKTPHRLLSMNVVSKISSWDIPWRVSCQIYLGNAAYFILIAKSHEFESPEENDTWTQNFSYSFDHRHFIFSGNTNKHTS